MGARTVTDLASGMAAMTAFADPQGAGKAVREHCVGTAAIVRALAYRMSDGFAPSAAFLAGLLHDIGKLLIMQTRHQSYTELVAAAGGVPTRSTCANANSWATITRCWAACSGQVGTARARAQGRAWHHQPARAYQQGGHVAALVAVFADRDVMDSMVCNDKPTDGAALKRLAAGSDAVHSGIHEKDIAATLAEAPKLRGEALMLFR